jgi:hypothetical protein
MPDPTPGSFRLFDHLGNVLAHGATATEAMAPLPDSAERNRFLAELRQLRADAEEAKATQARVHKAQVHAFCDGVARLSRRLDALEVKHSDEKRRKKKAKAQREKRAISDYLAQLPDPDNPASYGDEGELTTHAPSHLEDKEQLRAITAGDDDNEGDLPPDLKRSVPPTPGNYAWPPLDQPAKQVPQPTAIQLNSEVQHDLR